PTPLAPAQPDDRGDVEQHDVAEAHHAGELRHVPARRSARRAAKAATRPRPLKRRPRPFTGRGRAASLLALLGAAKHFMPSQGTVGCTVATSQPIPLPNAAPAATSVGKCFPAATRSALTPTAPAYSRIALRLR